MAVSETIQEILQGIDDAQYGRDMRDYIHKGIQKCYEEGSAGETDLQARNSISNILGDFATVETSSTASKSYSVGECMILNDLLYKVISSISLGDTLTVDTNIELTTVSDEMQELVNNLICAPDVSRATFTSLGDTYGDLTINESAWYAITNGSADGMVSIVYWFSDEEVYLPVVAGAKMTPWLYLEAGATGYKYTSSVNTSRLVKAPSM